MRKRILLVSGVLLCLVVAMSLVQAADKVPQRLNATLWNYTGFEFDTDNDPAALIQTNTYFSSGSNGTTSLSGNATVTDAAGTGTDVTTYYDADATIDWLIQNQNIGSIGNLIAHNNTVGAPTDATFYITDPSYNLMAGVSIGALGSGVVTTDGPRLDLLVQNLTILNNTTDVAGTWYFFALGADGGTNATATAGRMVLAAGGTGTLTSYAVNASAGNSTFSDTLVWAGASNNGVGGQTSLSINGTVAGVLFDKAFISADKNIMIGSRDDTGDLLTGIALKASSPVVAADFASKSLRAVSLSKGVTSATTNATLTEVATDSTGAVLVGRQAAFTTADATNTGDFAGTFAVTSRTLNGLTFGAATVNGATFIGHKVGDIMAGILVPQNGNANVGLQVFMPTTTLSDSPVPASAAEVNNVSTSVSGIVGANGATVQLISGAATDFNAVAGNMDGKLSSFVNATEAVREAEILATGQSFDYSYVSDFIFTATNIGAGNAGNMTLTKVGDIPGNQKLISELAPLYKVYTNAVVSPITGTSFAENSTRAFTYLQPGATVTDGSYWFSPSGFPNIAMAQTQRLTLGQTFDLWMAIQDGGNYDLDGLVNGIVLDPAVPIAGGAAGAAGIGDGDNGGCVFNPAASMGAELLLLLAVPAAWFIRRRKK
jgi:hypothetical protein